MAHPLASRLRRLFASLPAPDLFLFGGLALLFYGFYLYRRWMAFAICGALLMVYGLFMGLSEKK